MNLFVNADTGAFQVSTAVSREVTSLTMKRGDSNTVSLTPVSSNAVFTIPGTVSDMYFVVKEDFDEASPVLILANDWTLASGVWSSPITQDVDEIETLLAGAEFKDVSAEVTWTSSTTGVFSSQTIRFRIYNDVWKGSESAPISYPAGYATPLELFAAIPTQGSTAPTSISAAAIDWDAGNFRQKTLTGNTTFTFSNVTADDIIEVYLTQTSGNSWGVNWPAGITWASGSAPGVPLAGTSTRVVLHAITGSTFHGYFETAATVPTTVAGTDPVVLGRSAICHHSDGTFTTWEATRLSPATWVPTTAGIVKNRTSGQWMRTFVSSSTLQTEVLPDQ